MVELSVNMIYEEWEMLTAQNHSLCSAPVPPSVAERIRARRMVRRHSVNRSQ